MSRIARDVANVQHEDSGRCVVDNIDFRLPLPGWGVIGLQLWDTAGQERLDLLRKLSYRDTQVFLLCFDLSQPATLQNVETLWAPEIKSVMKGEDPFAEPMLYLIGTFHGDCESIPEREIAEIHRVQTQIGAAGFSLLSDAEHADTQEVVEDVLHYYLQAAGPQMTSMCTML
jgi:GTPase SAR1 family protein